jgi:plastocyanin
MALAVGAALTLVGCGGSSTESSEASTAPPTASNATTIPETPAQESGEYLIIAPANAAEIGFDPAALEVPEGTAFSVTFENQDAGIPHNIVIYEGTTATGTPVFAPEDMATVTGEDDVVYEVPALEAGTYTFVCNTHPTTMIGTLTAA